jgi:Na+/proline symporter
MLDTLAWYIGMGFIIVGGPLLAVLMLDALPNGAMPPLLAGAITYLVLARIFNGERLDPPCPHGHIDSDQCPVCGH